ncbi:hypothetical protein Y590_20505 [Methylobacterium sp. AMS5]|nr:hypothetical protein Y590_20505 [Methylobacterium sp. AMS5]
MALPIVFNNTVFRAGQSGGATQSNSNSTSFSVDAISRDSNVVVNGTISNPNDPVTFVINRFGFESSATYYATNFDDPSLIVLASQPNGAGGASSYIILSNSPLTPGQVVNVSNASLGDYNVLCFGSGTHILTERGEVAVEDLRERDVAVTASGARRTITWIGHRVLDGGGRALHHDRQPVRVRAGAFGGGLPKRDLFLSPGHPVLVGADADNEGGVLVPVMCLINGTTVTREPVASVTYWHVELDSHDILLAEGLPAESYIDGGDRAFFSEASDHALHNPDFMPAGWGARCRPVAVDGPQVEAERLRLGTVFAAILNRHGAWSDGALAL